MAEVRESGAAAMWSDAGTAREWMAGDDLETMLALPRRIAMSLAGRDGEVRRVLDVASGPGAFLEVACDHFAAAEGVWFDVSDVMQEAAEARLARFGDRVRFVRGDMAALAQHDVGTGFDLIVSSRATHHLLPAELHEFYASANRLLRPGGWLANLDHVGVSEVWEARLKASRSEFRPSRASESAHRHDHPRPSLDEHLSGLQAAQLNDHAIAWSAFYTVLVVARKSAD